MSQRLHNFLLEVLGVEAYSHQMRSIIILTLLLSAANLLGL